MRRYHDYRGLGPGDRGAAVAMGNFDGVHLDHQSVLVLAHAAAARLGAPFGVVTFEPHPRAFFAPAGAPFRLMTAEAHWLVGAGLLDRYTSEITLLRAHRLVEQAQREIDEAQRAAEERQKPKGRRR